MTAGTARVIISGELDVVIAPLLAERLAQVIAAKPQRLVFDLAGVEFIDCAAAGLIVGLGRHLPEGQRPIIRPASQAVRRLLELTGLDNCCEVAG